MKRPKLRLLSCSLVAAAALILSGCAGEVIEQARNAAKQDLLRNRLKELGMAFHTFHDMENRAPASWADLERGGLSSEARQEIEGAGYTLVLGVGFREATIGSSNFVIAYPANASGDSLPVATMDGAVFMMSQGELQQKLADQQQNMGSAVVVRPSAGDSSSGPPSAAPGGSGPPAPPPPPPPAVN
jgi:hypothetical protein